MITTPAHMQIHKDLHICKYTKTCTYANTHRQAHEGTSKSKNLFSYKYYRNVINKQPD